MIVTNSGTFTTPTGVNIVADTFTQDGTGSSIIGGNITADSAAVVGAGTGNITFNETITLNSTTADATIAFSTVSNSNIDLNDVGNSLLNTDNENISFSSTGGSGDITIDGTVRLDGGTGSGTGDLTVLAANNLTFSGPLIVETLRTSGVTGTTTLNGAISSSNLIDLRGNVLAANSTITTTNLGTVDINMTGNITFSAPADISANGDVSISSGAILATSADIITTNDDIYLNGFYDLITDVTYSGNTFLLQGTMRANSNAFDFNDFNYVPVFPPYSTVVNQGQQFPLYANAPINSYFVNAFASTQLFDNPAGLKITNILDTFQAEDRLSLEGTVIFGNGNTFVNPDSESTCLESSCVIDSLASDFDFTFQNASTSVVSEQLVSTASAPKIHPIF